MSELPTSAIPGKASDQRPEHPDFWCKRFAEGATPWDAGKVPAALGEFLKRRSTAGTVLIPGCGSAWEAAAFAARGWRVTALDFSPAAVRRAREVLADQPVDVVCADFFTYAAPVPDLLYERAFLCALPRKLWADWARRVAELLPSGGLLAGYFFVCEQLKGPPFGIRAEQLTDLLAANFVLLEDSAVDDSIAVFAGRERWQVWQRR